MSRPLVPGLIAEGTSDELFLKPLIRRQLADLLTAPTRHEAMLMDVETEPGSFTVAEQSRVRDAVLRLAELCDVVFIHHDHRERLKADKLVRLDCWNATRCPVLLVPRIETEAWLLADPGAFKKVKGAQVGHLPALPKLVEKIHDPKATLKKVVAGANLGDGDEYRELLGQTIDLRKLEGVPAYQEWLNATRGALTKLGYI